MAKNLAVITDGDHDCRTGAGAGCRVCTRLYFERSRLKWNNFLDKMSIIHKRSQQRRIVHAFPGQQKNN